MKIVRRQWTKINVVYEMIIYKLFSLCLYNLNYNKITINIIQQCYLGVINYIVPRTNIQHGSRVLSAKMHVVMHICMLAMPIMIRLGTEETDKGGS